MPSFSKKEPELLPGAVLEDDCQTAAPVDIVAKEQNKDDNHDDDHEHDVTWTAVPENAGAAGVGLAASLGGFPLRDRRI